MSTATTHQLAIKAKDGTAPAFKSIQSRAAGAGSKISSLLGGALAAAGGYLGARAIVSGINELGKLSDVAQATSTSVDELTRSSNALQILGIRGASVESMAHAFMFMEKNTGRSGMEGFYQTIEEIGKLPDAASRSEAAMAAFGRSGMMFLPLINAADKGTEALRGVVEVMPSIPQSAAEAGDKMSDAKLIGVEGFKSLWYQAIGKLSEWFDQMFSGGVREATAKGVAYFEYFCKLAFRQIRAFVLDVGEIWTGMGGNMTTVLSRVGQYFIRYFKSVSEFFKTFWYADLEDLFSGKAMELAVLKYRKGLETATEKLFEGVNWDKVAANGIDDKDIRAALEKKLAAAGKFELNYGQAAESTRDREGRTGKGGGGNGDLGSSVSKAIQNSLIMANTAQATRLAMMGPQFSEEKKHTSQYDKMISELQKMNKSLGGIKGEKFETFDS